MIRCNSVSLQKKIIALAFLKSHRYTRDMKTIVSIIVTFFGLSICMQTTYAGVSSISQDTVATEELQTINEERLLLKSFISRYTSKYGIQRLESVYNKLTEEHIMLFPSKYRPYLIRIREILEEDYGIGKHIPTAQEIRNQ